MICQSCGGLGWSGDAPCRECQGQGVVYCCEGERAEPEPQRVELVVMRLDRMFVTRADQDNSRVCDECGKPVGIYPSGQRVLMEHPDATIICDVCVGARSDLGRPAPGALEEASRRN